MAYIIRIFLTTYLTSDPLPPSIPYKTSIIFCET